MDSRVIERAMGRLASAAGERADAASVEAALERARAQVESLAQAAAELESVLPARVGEAVRDGMRAEALPVARQIGELRGLMNSFVRGLERIEGDLLAERHARVDDLALLVDLVTSGWQSVDARLAHLERGLTRGNGASAFPLGERQAQL